MRRLRRRSGQLKTLLDSDGPHHPVISSLRLGAASEIDADGRPTATANGDDTDLLDDEDGVAAAIVQRAGEETTVSVSVTNTTGAAATLAGWIDVNNNGIFDTGERATATVAPGTNNGTATLTFPEPTTATSTFARFRLFPGSQANPLPTGAADGGEVEDYAGYHERLLDRLRRRPRDYGTTWRRTAPGTDRRLQRSGSHCAADARRVGRRRI